MIQNHQFAILLPLVVGAGAVECTIAVRALAFATTVNLFRHEKRRGRLGTDVSGDLVIIALVISVAFVAHLTEIGMWAVLFVLQWRRISRTRDRLLPLGGQLYDPRLR